MQPDIVAHSPLMYIYIEYIYLYVYIYTVIYITRIVLHKREALRALQQVPSSLPSLAYRSPLYSVTH